MIQIKGQFNTANVMIDEIDPATRGQIQDFVNNPSFAGSYIAVMPDCLHPDTEVLTPKGFICIKDLDEESDEVASFDISTGTYSFELPTAIIQRPLRRNEKVYSLLSDRLGVVGVQTENHRNAYIPSLGMLCKDLPTTNAVKDFIWTARSNKMDDNTSDAFLQFIAWVVGDGNIYKNNNKNPSYRLRFGVKKDRKITRIMELCSSLQLTPTVRYTNKQTSIEFGVEDSKQFIDVVGIAKKYPISYIQELSNRQKRLFLEEALKVDGDYEAYSKGKGFRLNSKRKEDIDFFSALSVDIGTSSIKYRNSISNLTGENNEMYYINIIPEDTLQHGRSGLHNSKITVTESETSNIHEVVCISCSTGYFVYRFKGRTGITGNCHKGAGSCIGFTMLMNNRIIPDVVGVDIGCGMLSAHYDVDDFDPVGFDAFVKNNIPSGFSIRDQAPTSVNFYNETVARLGLDVGRVARSLGTLGGGNHFIEVGKDPVKGYWVTIHSGSRNFGLQIAKYYGELAKTLCNQWGAEIRGIPFLLSESPEGKAYIKDQQIGAMYASVNRTTMQQVLNSFFGKMPTEIIESVHNFIDTDGMIRKGATPAHKGQKVIIPFNMRDGLAICTGLGNSKYNFSAPHGAGRILSRSKAKETLDVDYFVEDMRASGVYTTSATKETLDESPDAYKDMAIIMSNISETVTVNKLIKPVYNFKAGGE